MRKEYLIYKLSDWMKSAQRIPLEAFQIYGVKRGLHVEKARRIEPTIFEGASSHPSCLQDHHGAAYIHPTHER